MNEPEPPRKDIDALEIIRIIRDGGAYKAAQEKLKQRAVKPVTKPKGK